VRGGMAVSYDLTTEGRQNCRDRTARRADVSRRQQACREALLNYLAGKTPPERVPIGEFSAAPQAMYEGVPFEESDLFEARRYLVEHGLVTAEWSGMDDIGHLTAEGHDVIDDFGGSLKAFRGAQRSGESQFQTHFHGDVHGMVGIGESVSQTQHQGLAAGDVFGLLDAVRSAATELPPAERTIALTYADLIQAEAQEPDDTLRKRALERLQGIASKAGTTALGVAVTALTQYLMSQ
jgi:hypothetical protein